MLSLCSVIVLDMHLRLYLDQETTALIWGTSWRQACLHVQMGTEFDLNAKAVCLKCNACKLLFHNLSKAFLVSKPSKLNLFSHSGLQYYYPMPQDLLDVHLRVQTVFIPAAETLSSFSFQADNCLRESTKLICMKCSLCFCVQSLYLGHMNSTPSLFGNT